MTTPGSSPWQRTDIGIIGLMAEEWGPRWSTRHQVMARLARMFPTIWVSPPCERPDVPARAWDALRRRQPAVRPSGEPGLEVYTPEFWLPHLYRPAPLADALFRWRLRRAASLLRRRGVRHLVLYIWRPNYHQAPALLGSDLVVYHVDDDYAFSDTEAPTSPQEEELLRGAGLVIVHSPGLMRKKGGYNPQTMMSPNGGDFAVFATPQPAPADLLDIPSPRLGYTGAIKKHLDWDLIEGLATHNPSWNLVFVGDRENHPELEPTLDRLARFPNIHFLGVRPYVEVPAYVQHFDVCLMPYARMGHNNYIYPLKLHEYLAAGRPIVASPIATLESFGGAIRLESDLDGWTRAIADALAPEALSPAAIEGRRAVARQHDWDLLVGRIADRIVDRLPQPAGSEGGSPHARGA